MILLAALPSGCSVPNPAPKAQRSIASASAARAAGWEKVEVDGSFRTMTAWCGPGTFAAGVRDGQPLLVKVGSGGAREVKGTFPNVDRNGLGAVVVNDGGVFATEELDPARAKRATLWLGEYYTGYFPPEKPQWQQLWNTPGVIPKWLSPVTDDEGGLRAVGAVLARGRWELHAWEAAGDDKWFSLDRGHQLYVHAKPSSRSVLASSIETAVLVAGSISDRADGSAASPQVWFIDDATGFQRGHWTRLAMASTPDSLSDVAQWAVGWWVAGSRHLRPVVYDFDNLSGDEMPVPDTHLDPARPGVFIAGDPIGHPMVLATQSADGPTLWVGKGKSWQRIPAPAGTLSAAQMVKDGVYLLIDGALWFRPMPGHTC